MSTIASFLDAIRAAPDDDGLRLVFADWLEDHGKGCWAGIIRRQVRLRDPDALDQGWPLWAGPLTFFWGPPPDMERLAVEMGYPIPFEPHQLSRGFVSRVALDAAEFLEIGPSLAAWGPMPAIELKNVGPHLDALAACPALAAVTALDLRTAVLSADRLQVLLGSPHLGRLANLNLGNRCGLGNSRPDAHAVARFLARTCTLPALERLCLDHTPIGDDGLATLADGPALRGLTALTVEGCGITGTGFTSLNSSPWPRLRHLKLFGNRLGSAGAEVLAGSPQLATLWSLKLNGTDFTDRAACVLGRSPYPTQLRDLDLSMDPVGDEGFIALARSPALGELRRLKLRYSKGRQGVPERPHIGPHGGAALAQAAFASRLRVLDLSQQKVSDAGLVGLAASGGYTHLEELQLSENEIGDTGVLALVGATQLQRLTTLRLSGNHIGPAGARALAGWSSLTRLKWASLDRNPLGPDGVEVMLRRASLEQQTKSLADVIHLILTEMDVGDEGVVRLTAWDGLASCASLELLNNGITAHGARLLAASPGTAQLRQLEIGGNPIGDEGAAALAASPHFQGLEDLGLGSCGLTDAGVMALVGSPYLKNLQVLTVFDNTLTDAGARALLRGPWRDLHIGLRGLNEGREALQERFGDKVKFY
jgi:uncharacterized protein (TIGR02996 family)